MMRVLLCLFFLLFPLGALAQNNILAVDLAEDHVDITSGFNGAQLVLFGVKDKPGDVAVVIRGPRHTIAVRRKEQVAGMWLNRRAMKFRNVPLYYDYALSRPEKQLSKGDNLKEAGIGLDALYFTPDDSSEDAQYIQNFQEAMIRTKQTQGLYPLKPKGVKFLQNNFFRVSFYLPANVPIGTYEVESYLLKDGEVLEDHTTQLRVGQVGFGARVYQFAQRHGFSYGLVCVLMAVMAGWAVNLLRQRD